MRLFVISLALTIPVLLQAQVVQKGKVVEQNSGDRPLPAVSVLISGAMPVSSDDGGMFIINVPKGKDGDRVVVFDISKTGYELVNQTDVEQWNLSSSEPFTIVMCREGLLDEARRKYYNLGRDVYRERYFRAAEDLKDALEKASITTQEYESRMAEAEAALVRAMDRLEGFADRFARVNRDDLSELDRRAFECLDAGDIDGAIKVYEEADLLNKFREKRMLRDSIKDAKSRYSELIGRQIEILRQKKTVSDSLKADSLSVLIF